MFRRRRRSDPWYYTHYEDVREHDYGGDDLAETGRQRYYRQIREIRDELGVSHDEARRRWSDYYAPGGVPIKPVKRLQLALRASTTNQRTCPFCRDAIYHPDEGGPDYVCSSCQAHYHLDCFEEELQGRCATIGCAARRLTRRVRPRRRRRRQDDAERLVTQDAAEEAARRTEAPTEAQDASWRRFWLLDSPMALAAVVLALISLVLVLLAQVL